jgi:hypothetical protein
LNTPSWVGYYDHDWQDEPTYDPGLDADCPICHEPLRDWPVRTTSLMAVSGTRSLFYRMHQHCASANWTR